LNHAVIAFFNVYKYCFHWSGWGQRRKFWAQNSNRGYSRYDSRSDEKCTNQVYLFFRFPL